VTSREGLDAQEFVLDTEREVASYTVMFHLAPAATHTLTERRIAGVDVRVLAPVGGVSSAEAFALLEPWLPALQGDLGPFPMPRGLGVVLTQSGRRDGVLRRDTTSASARSGTRSFTCTSAAAPWPAPTATPGGTRRSPCGTSSRAAGP